MTLDTLAKRYGCRPSEILRGDFADFVTDAKVAEAGMDAERQAATRARHAALRNRRG